MNLYNVCQDQNDDYDTYSQFIVCAENEEIARNTDPDGGTLDWKNPPRHWCRGPDHVIVTLIGVAAIGIKEGIICSSFHAG